MRNVIVFLGGDGDIVIPKTEHKYYWQMEYIGNIPLNVMYTRHNYTRKRDAKRGALRFAKRHNFKIVKIED